MMRIQTGRRLHFGLFTPIPVPELNLVFGGLGAMVSAPGVIVCGNRSNHWQVEGCEVKRTSELVERIQEQAPQLQPVAIQVEYVAPAHQGWGTGTQLALAITDLVHCLNEISIISDAAARYTSRGQRSGIGVQGYRKQGLFFDHGKRLNETASISHVDQIPLPANWRLVLVEPTEGEGLHSINERRAFGRITEVPLDTVRQLQTLAHQMVILLKQNPDFATFAKLITSYNALAGELFLDVQGGRYSSPLHAERILHMQNMGAMGAGQSSWGPGLFAFFPDVAEAESFIRRCHLPGCRMLITQS